MSDDRNSLEDYRLLEFWFDGTEPIASKAHGQRVTRWSSIATCCCLSRFGGLGQERRVRE